MRRMLGTRFGAWKQLAPAQRDGIIATSMMIAWRTVIQDLLEESPLRWLVFSRHRWLLLVPALLLVVALGVGGGWLIAELGPLPVAVLVAGLVYAVWVLYDLDVAYVGVITVIALLPFASLPFRFGFTPTFLNLTLFFLFGAWLLTYLLGEEQRLITTPVGGAVLAFALLAIVAFVAGLSHGTLNSYLLRHFAEILLGIGVFYLVVNTVRDTERLQRLVRWIILAASAAALLGIVLYFLPEELTIRVLSALARFGYPAGPEVIWHIRDDPSLMKRATATSVHPNVLGSLLNFGLVLLAPHLLAKRPLLPRLILWALAGLLAFGLVLTVSRSAMVGVAVAVFVISLMRYRRFLFLIALIAALVLISPWSRALVDHFVEGFQREDLSTEMRMGEYKDTLTLIRRYPFLGVGFAGAPDLDIYVAVASLYLIIAAQMGLVGLLAFLVVLWMVLKRFWQRRGAVKAVAASNLEPLWYGVHAAIISGAVSGIFDHYFFSLDFAHSVTLFWLLVGLATAATLLLDEPCSG